MIGERVRHLRHYYGWSQGELAALAGVSQPAVSQIERTGAASEETVRAIAQATQFPVEYFHRGPLPEMPLGSLKFRKLASSTKKNDDRVRAHVRQAVELVRTFEPIVKLPPVRFQAISLGAALDDIAVEAEALRVREILGVGPSDPISNLVRSMERCGVLVIGSVSEIEKHDAASYWPAYPEGRPIVCCSKGMPGDRQRFSNGHELGHLVLHTLRELEPRAAEAEANRFAGALLLPAEAALEFMPQPVTLRGLAYVKARFGISVGALIRRAFDLQLIDDTRRVSLEKQLTSRGWRKQEPVAVAEEEPRLIRRFVEAATGQQTMTKIAGAVGYAPLITRELVA